MVCCLPSLKYQGIICIYKSIHKLSENSKQHMTILLTLSACLTILKLSSLILTEWNFNFWETHILFRISRHECKKKRNDFFYSLSRNKKMFPPFFDPIAIILRTSTFFSFWQNSFVSLIEYRASNPVPFTSFRVFHSSSS